MPTQPAAADAPDFTEVWTAAASPSQNAYVQDVAYAQIDGRPVALAVAGTTLAAWDLASGERLAAAPPSGPTSTSNVQPHPSPTPTNLIHIAATSSAGTPIALTGDAGGHVQVWDLRSGERLGAPLTELGSRVQALAAMPQPETAAGAVPGPGPGLALAPGANLALIARAPGATSTVYSVPVADQGVEVWDIAARNRVRSLHHGGYTDSIAVGEHDGRALAVASATFSNSPLIDTSDAESRIFVWDLATGERLGEPLHPAQEDQLIGSVAVGSVAGHAVVVAESGGSLYAWERNEPRPTVHIPTPGTVKFVTWTTVAGRPVVLASGGNPRPDGRSWLAAWDPQTWHPLAQAEPGYGVLARFAPAPDGRVILPWAKSVKVLHYEGTS